MGYIEIVYVCTANVNRSAMAAALTSRMVHQHRLDVRISSASIMERPGQPPTENTLSVLRDKGIDAAGHRSRTLTAEIVAGADLVLTMERMHLRTAAVLTPDAFGKTFTLKEFLRRGLQLGPRGEGEALEVYLKRAGAERDPMSLLSDDEDDNVVDPQGEPRPAFVTAVDELELLSRGVLYLLFGLT